MTLNRLYKYLHEIPVFEYGFTIPAQYEKDVRWAFREVVAEVEAEQERLAPLFDSIEKETVKQAMQMHYIQGVPVDAIAEQMGYCDRHIKRLLIEGKTEMEKESCC